MAASKDCRKSYKKRSLVDDYFNPVGTDVSVCKMVLKMPAGNTTNLCAAISAAKTVKCALK